MDKTYYFFIDIYKEEIMRGCRENRELSWLKFNDRVLMQAKDKKYL